MKIDITTLVENSSGEHLQLASEHGLSFYVRAGETSVLFDTGASGHFMENAALLGLDLGAVSKVLISHGHYDHSGGYRSFMDKEISGKSRLVVKPGFFDRKYGVKANSAEFLGNSFTESMVAARGIGIEVVDEDVREVASGVYSVSGFERTCPMEKLNPRFQVERGGELVQDDFCDEQAMVVRSPKGLIVILGCSHPGLINILDSVKKWFNEKIHAVLGGTHLVEAGQDRLEKTMAYLIAQDIPVIGISHCSGGPEHRRYMESRLQGRFFHNSTGTQFSV